MKIYGVTALAVLLFVGVTTANAQRSDPMWGVTEEIEEVDVEVRAVPEAVQDTGYTGYTGCTSCTTGCDPCCRSAGWLGGIELTYLKAHNAEGFGPPAAAVRFNYEPAVRAWLGYSNADGLGIQLRVWDFDHSATDGVNTLRLNTNVLDAEVTSASEIGINWDALITAGYRHVDGSTRPLVAHRAARPAGRHCLAHIGQARGQRIGQCDRVRGHCAQVQTPASGN